ncbi:hypothetical protein ACIQTT_08020 [Microbacterium sp. NPDC090225]|uniref:hypothetical protein n=1 Tax=Microbacterium sp. NPDC090225 TaxID=3364207 RepID=UPI0038201D88
MKPVVRLAGDDASVTAVAKEAVEVLRAQPQAASALFSRLWNLHQRRRRFVSASAAPAIAAATAPARARSSAGYRAVWGTLLGLGLTAALTSAVMLGPSDRRNAFMNPELAMSTAVIAGAIAIPVLLITLLLKVPDVRSARIGETFSVLVGLLCVAMLVVRLILGTGDDRGFTPDDLAIWLPMTAVIALLIAGVAIRSDLVRRQDAAPSTGARTSVDPGDLRQMRRDAEWAASSSSPTPTDKAEWSRRLDALASAGIDATTIAQARTLAPAAWVAWLAYDGELDIAGVIPRP